MMQTNLVPIIHALIIDDHKLVRDGLKTMLGSLKFSYHFDISEAENGEEAIRKIRKRNFDIIIIDYQLPGMSGAETVEQIRRNLPQAKIIALSNYNELQNIKSMMDAGANGYILKNVEPSGLLSAIRTILDGKSYYSSEVAN